MTDKDYRRVLTYVRRFTLLPSTLWRDPHGLGVEVLVDDSVVPGTIDLPEPPARVQLRLHPADYDDLVRRGSAHP